MSFRGPSVHWTQALAVASSLGFEFALSVGLGCFSGYLLDRWIGWRPIVFTLLFGLMGSVAGFVLMVQTLRRFEAMGSRKRNEDDRA